MTSRRTDLVSLPSLSLMCRSLRGVLFLSIVGFISPSSVSSSFSSSFIACSASSASHSSSSSIYSSKTTAGKTTAGKTPEGKLKSPLSKIMERMRVCKTSIFADVLYATLLLTCPAKPRTRYIGVTIHLHRMSPPPAIIREPAI